jgi:superfamily I DNA/RNA helicase/mRNA-degrading endonuclease RelE of RelBE toxin-antitoxin system
MSGYVPTLSREFVQDLASLPPPVQAKTTRTLLRMIDNPWAREYHPEQVRRAEPGVHSCRVDDDYRVIWKHIKPDHILFCLVDKHDPAYRRAARKSFALQDGVVRMADILEVGAQVPDTAPGGLFAQSPRTDAGLGELFIGYRDQELLDMGVPADVLSHIRALNELDQLPAVERLLPVEVFDRLLAIALGEVERPVVPDAELRTSIERFQGGEALCSFVDSEEFRRALEGDMQEWMLFLAPDQRQIVNRQYAGPARIRGVAGSGKTVIAIHRARQLARQFGGEGSVLFLTFGNRLPNVIRHLLEQLAGAGAPELKAIECCTLHQWCGRFLKRLGCPATVGKEGDVHAALQEGIAAGRQAYPHLNALWRRAPGFFGDEIKYAIKGRAIERQDEYLALERSGRGTALGEAERQAMWTVFQAYQAQLQRQGHCDWEDVILRALKLAQAGALPTPYRAAVVDEIQDLSEATLRLVRAIVARGENDLFLVGDGLQRLYPGGYTLGRVGIDITGRGTLLRRNYRNTHEILRAAYAMMQDVRYNDMEDQATAIPQPEYSLRHGPLPVLRGFGAPDEEIAWVIERMQEMKARAGYQDDAFAILYRMREPYVDLITRHVGTRCVLVELTNDARTYFGPGVKHSTFDSAKGLEFKVVFVVGVTDGRFVPYDDWSQQPGPELEEYLLRERSRLFVAMTRARDELHLTYSRGGASRFLAGLPAEFLASG